MKTCAGKFGLYLVSLSILLTGCSTARVLMPTPNVHLAPDQDMYTDLAEPLQSTEVRLIYVTDRSPERDEKGKLYYGNRRSNSLAFGTTVVDLGRNITWNELLEASRTQQRLKPVELEVLEVTEQVRGPNIPLPYALIEGKVVHEPRLLAEHKASAEAFRESLVSQLELTPRKEVFIYIHGYRNTFDDAAFAMAELWHFLGRVGVPIIYTWPAGYPGLFGYTYDRESSEFTIYHLRETLKFISSFPEVEKIHLIAHSRGTDVAVAAVRELTLLARGAGIDPRQRFKLHNLVLAAPDLDADVAMQRIAGDQLALSVNRLTIYASPADKAIGYAGTLFQSPRGRVGNFGMENMDETMKNVMEYGQEYNANNFAAVYFSGAKNTKNTTRDRHGHSYFRDAPTVSSDLVLLLRDDLNPGTPGRPLVPIGARFWQVPQGYPKFD